MRNVLFRIALLFSNSAVTAFPNPCRWRQSATLIDTLQKSNIKLRQGNCRRGNLVVLGLTKSDEEEARLRLLRTRRETIRTTLKDAEALKNVRLRYGLVPKIDEETGKPIKSDSRLALTLTAFVIAAGAVTLRVGGRAALVSAIGLDFANGENPEMRESMNQFLSYAGSLDPILEAIIFVGAWTVVKVFCFDAGGIVLALSAGILFGGVLKGAFASALAASIGSSVAFFLAKIDTPVRKKALELLEANPSLRGIEKVVAEDGLKAILTLRLAPVLPIPIGFYNYVYGVTNVPFIDFFGGIFIGSFKPYLLDSYLGYFGKQLIEGNADSGSVDDTILLVILAVSVLIGVFASQLANETWDSVKEEIEADQKKRTVDGNEMANDGIVSKVAGIDLPQWLIGMQLSIQESNKRIEQMIQIEYKAAVWNYTDVKDIPNGEDPASFFDSPENIVSDFDIGRAICDGFVLSPALLRAYFKYSDPLYEETFLEWHTNKKSMNSSNITSIHLKQQPEEEEGDSISFITTLDETASDIVNNGKSGIPIENIEIDLHEKEYLLQFLLSLRKNVEHKVQEIEKTMKNLK